jgi:sensor histidine kinase regulating citrate/malate metabolism
MGVLLGLIKLVYFRKLTDDMAKESLRMDKKRNAQKEEAMTKLKRIISLYDEGDLNNLIKIAENKKETGYYVDYCDSKFLNRIINKYKMKCENNSINFNVNITYEIEEANKIRGLNAKKINILLGNLVDNAIDELQRSTKVEKKTIGLCVDVVEDNLTYKISNNGNQIKEADMDKIFNKGFSTKATNRGTGLYIVSILASELNANIYVESNKVNTSFIIKFYGSV